MILISFSLISDKWVVNRNSNHYPLLICYGCCLVHIESLFGIFSKTALFSRINNIMSFFRSILQTFFIAK